MEHKEELMEAMKIKDSPSDQKLKVSDIQKIEELTNLAKNIQADFENYKKRVEKEKPGYVNIGKMEVFKSLFPIYEAIQKGLENDNSSGTLHEGIVIVFQQLQKLFNDHNVKSFPNVNDKFDPNLHEAMMIGKDSNFGDNVILEVFQKGWKMDEQVLQHAKVKVNKTEE